MMSDAFTWAGRIRADAASALGTIRLIRGLQGGVLNGEVWVRGPSLKSHDEEAVHQVPWEERYEVAEDGRLRRMDRILSDESLPPVAWSSLAIFLRGRLQPPLAAGAVDRSVPVELRPDETVREPNLLEAETRDWMAYVETAPEIRLQRLAFAVSENEPERVLIRGVPLPPLPGIQYVEAEFLATPAGSRWYPSVTARSLRRAFGAEETELVILRQDATWCRVPRSAWIAAARSAVRLIFSPERYAG